VGARCDVAEGLRSEPDCSIQGGFCWNDGKALEVPNLVAQALGETVTVQVIDKM
jgi:hypothetical protein